MRTLLSIFISIALPVNVLLSQNSDFEVLKSKTVYEYYTNMLIETDSFVYQVNARTGEQYTKVNIPYSKISKVSNISAWIEDSKGNVVYELRNKDISDRSAFSYINFYSDNFIKSFQIKHNTYPYKIHVSYKTTSKQYITEVWNPVRDLNIPVKEAHLFIHTFGDVSIKWNAKNTSQCDSLLLGNKKSYHWKAQYLKPIQNELFSIPERYLPQVMVSALNFKYDIKGNANSWSSYGNWVFKLYEGMDELPEGEKIIIKELIKNEKDKKEIVKVLYHYLQDRTRYVNVSLKTGGHKPYPTSYVSQNKYGDCKALTNYMKAILKFAGINSNFVLINSGHHPDSLVRDVPGAQFNHIILLVPMGKDTIWLENTANDTPFGYVGTSIQNKTALLIDSTNSRLISTPIFETCDVKSIRIFDYRFNETNDADVNLKFLYKGYGFEYYNWLKGNDNNYQNEKIKYLMPFKTYDVHSWDLKKFNRDADYIELISNLNVYKVLNPLGDDKYFSIIRSEIPSFEKPENRTLPLELPYPIHTIDSVNFSFSSNSFVKSVPNDTIIETDYGRYSIKYKSNNNKFSVYKEFTIYPAYYSTIEYRNFYKFIDGIKDIEIRKIILSKSTTN